MLIQTQVGPIATIGSLPPGVQAPLRSGQLGDVVVSELHGRYYEQAYRRNVFYAANQAAQATSVALATAYTGIMLSNPIGNPFNLVILKIGAALSVAPAAISAIGLMTGFNSGVNVTHTVALTPGSQFVGVGAAPTGKVDSSATLPTAPLLTTLFMGGFTAAALPPSPNALFDMEGSIVLPPGAYAGIYTLTAVTGLFSVMWEEVPI